MSEYFLLVEKGVTLCIANTFQEVLAWRSSRPLEGNLHIKCITEKEGVFTSYTIRVLSSLFYTEKLKSGLRIRIPIQNEADDHHSTGYSSEDGLRREEKVPSYRLSEGYPTVDGVPWRDHVIEGCSTLTRPRF